MGGERPSPNDIVPATNLHWDGQSVTIDLRKLNIELNAPPKVWMPGIPDTNSMDGCFDYGNTNILIAGSTPEDHATLISELIVGDIAAYQTPRIYAIHRIIRIATDAQGVYFRFKGDNNFWADPERVRPAQIKWVSIGTIY